MSLNLGAYLRRIGFEGRADTSLQTLQRICLLHPRHIPFENLDPLLGRPVSLGLDALQRKLVDERRGGFCYEHNLLLKTVLEALGFRVTGLAARVLWGSPDDPVRPRTHMLLKVELDDGPRIVDAGFGGLTLTGVLHLAANAPQSTPHERFRLLRTGHEYVVQAEVNGEWRPLYAFDEQPQQVADYEMACWYLCHHPQSRFVTHLLAARTEGDCRYGLLDHTLNIHRVGRASERRVIGSAGELRDVLESVFGVQLPDDPGLPARLQRLVAAA